MWGPPASPPLLLVSRPALTAPGVTEWPLELQAGLASPYLSSNMGFDLNIRIFCIMEKGIAGQEEERGGGGRQVTRAAECPTGTGVPLGLCGFHQRQLPGEAW